ncbi:MAG: sulfotransferase domain-containing protein [Bacteroidota bacterium]
MANIILCAGMRRSASTLQYNIVKRILEISGKGKALGYAESPDIEKIIEEHLDEEGYVVIKVHNYFPLAGDLSKKGKLRVVFSYRDIRDIIVSSMYKWRNGNFDKTYTPNYSSRLIESFRDWTSMKKVYSSSYENIIKDLYGEISKIAYFLEIELKEGEIKSLCEELDYENQKRQLSQKQNFEKTLHGEVDNETLLHKNHLRSGKAEQWRKELNNLQIAKIQREWKGWMKENNYSIHRTIFNNRTAFQFGLFWYKYYPKFKRKVRKLILYVTK